MRPDPRRGRVVTFDELARTLRERGRTASLAGHKRVAFAFYRRAERCEGIARRDVRCWEDWPRTDRVAPRR